MKTLIPWYLNNTLSPADRRKVETWLASRPDREALLAMGEQVQQAVQDRPFRPTPPKVEARIRAQIRAQGKIAVKNDAPTRWTWAFGLLLMTAVLFGLWFTYQPGVKVEWSASTQPIETYQVYRAIKGRGSFELLLEVTPGAVQERYSYVDLALWPGQTYSYQVVGIAADGQAANSPVVTGDTWLLIQNSVGHYFNQPVCRLWRGRVSSPCEAFAEVIKPRVWVISL